MDLLKKLYYDDLTGFQSADKLYKKAKAIDKSITNKQVKDFLAQQSTAQITKQVKKNKIFNTITSKGIRDNYQTDILLLPNPSQNKGFKYLLTVIDVYSRYAFVKPLKSKSGEIVLSAFEELMNENGLCKNLNCDLGSEFIYTPFVEYCYVNDITLYYSNPDQDNKNAIIERFHRTLRNLMLKYTVANDKGYINALPNLIKNYNTTFHNTIKTEPIEIWEGNKTNEQKIKKVENDFNVGDKVRHIIENKTFDKKSSSHTFTKTIYTISRIDGKSIYLDEMTKPYKSFQLVLAVGDEINSNYDKSIKKTNKKEKIIRMLRKEGII
jgi:hypothetical protein